MILYNAIVTPDGTIIESRHRHDFVCHTDKNGNRYCVDGGLDYLRRLGNIYDCIDISLYSEDDHIFIRTSFTWGSYGKDGTEPLRYIPICDMTDNHIQAVIDRVHHIPKEIKNIFINEQEYRK